MLCLLAVGGIQLFVAPTHALHAWTHGWFAQLVGMIQIAYAVQLLIRTKPTMRAARWHRDSLVYLIGLLFHLALLVISNTPATDSHTLNHHSHLAPTFNLLDAIILWLNLAILILFTDQLITTCISHALRTFHVSRFMPYALRFTLHAPQHLIALFILLTACTMSAETSTPTPIPTATPPHHETSEGLLLGGNTAESVYASARCPASAAVRAYDIVALNVEITLNRYGDYDPQGRMYALADDVQRVRQEEAQNKAARAGQGDFAVTMGLQGDAIQPLVIRVNQGECLRLTLRNELKDGEPASLHLHDSALYVKHTGAPAIATNANAMAAMGKSVTYEWMVTADEPEGTHYFHSHGNARVQTSLGLFGAVIVEPKGSTHWNPTDGQPLHSGWTAMIQPPTGSAFREFAVIYHEIGNERYRLLNKQGQQIPQVDPFTQAYRPASRALNYRSEPFMNRLSLQAQQGLKPDVSQAYSSYTFGDPATPIARSYLGDPVKQRVLHGGSEVFHVHHVHGGAIRWRRQPNVEDARFAAGLQKHPPLIPAATERIDSQTIGPAESYDELSECGSGGCQQSVGDYLIHCHVAHHYLAGMWGIWRVYNTLQDGKLSLDGLPRLRELPDRAGQTQAPITSEQLIGATVDWKGQTFSITKENLAEWVERQLPPPGTPKGYDASVMDWRKEGDRYLNELETDKVWAGYHATATPTRPPIYFDRVTGKLAYPFLRPHLGKRPPFAPNHGPAPFLEPLHSGADSALPGANGPWSLCPSGARIQPHVIHAINTPITYNTRADLVDPTGALYVLKEEEDLVRANNEWRTPPAFRANAGQDCVDIIFKSELEDNQENFFFSKINLHIHFMQFDVQASDGVSAGYNYEQSVRPFTVEGERMLTAASVGDDTIIVSNTARFSVGALVGVGMDETRVFEIKRIKAIAHNTLVFSEPLKFEHIIGEIVSTEFVRYRWYPDVQFGTAYFHDHVSALVAWRHGLVGAIISEPPDSTYHDPQTGKTVRSRPIADIHTTNKVSADITGSFREFVLFIQDDNPLTHLEGSSGSSFNLRVEPLARRARNAAPALIFNSQAHGDPATPIVQAYLGDPVVIRALVSASNDIHTLRVDGHWFRAEPWSVTSPLINALHIGISERYDLSLRAGGVQARAGDYLYYNGRAFKWREGSWGILRVLDEPSPNLQQLPDRPTISPARSLCPANAPSKEFNVVAIETALPMFSDGTRGKVFVLAQDKDALRAGARTPEPLVLHVNVGDCLNVNLKNELTMGSVSLHADMLAYDPRDAGGSAVGVNPSQIVAPGQTRTYTFYAHPDIGETAALLRDNGNVQEHHKAGLYGAIIVGPRGATYTHPVTGEELTLRASWRADAHTANGDYRDFALFMQDEDEVIGTALMPYTENVKGVVGINYRAEPLTKRWEKNKDTAKGFNVDTHGDPSTPIMEAFVGDAVRIHVFAPYSEQAQVFSLENHQWLLEPNRKGSDVLSASPIGGGETLTIQLLYGAGGRYAQPGNYLYGNHREPYREAGLWGLFRVYAKGATTKLKILR